MPTAALSIARLPVCIHIIHITIFFFLLAHRYLAALEAKDTGAIVGTGWGGIIFVLITANTLARGS